MKAVEMILVTAMGLFLAYAVATPVAKFIEQSFADAARNIEQMGARK